METNKMEVLSISDEVDSTDKIYHQKKNRCKNESTYL